MEIVLTLTTVLSLALTLGMGAALVYLLREERRRSAARVAALVEAAEEEGSFRPEKERRFRLKAEPTTPDLNLRPSAEVAGVAAMFSEPERSSPWGRRIAVAACVAAIVSAGGYLLLSRGNAIANGPASSAPVQAPLELLSLGHTQQAGSLTITGVVQNPSTGTALSRVSATVMLLSADGSLLASGRAPLDFLTIEPGDESPFVVNVPVTAPVARYRIGFRGEDGRVIAHVDRRASGTMALRN